MDQRIGPIASGTEPDFSGWAELSYTHVEAPPAGLVTLNARLESHAACHPERTALTFLRDGTRETACLNFGDLACCVGRVAASLAERGLGKGSVRRAREGQARVLLL